MPSRSDSPERLRRRLRERRAALEPGLREAAAGALCRRVSAQAVFERALRVAAYLAIAGEIDPLALLIEACDRGKAAYVPVLEPAGGLCFAAWRPDVVLVPNRFGIPEPAAPHQRCLDPSELDLVVTPLVAFDRRGTRLGMGGGYYDRAFSFMLKRGAGPRPFLVGAGYAFQEVPSLARNPWDVPLNAVATDEEWIAIEG